MNLYKSVSKKIFKVGIIGAGLMGNRRALAIKTIGGAKLVAASDANKHVLSNYCHLYNCHPTKNWRELVRRNDLDIVIVSTPNYLLKPITLKALANGKHVLVENPFGRNVAESKAMIAASKKYRKELKVGLNHRFHAAILDAKKIFDKGGIGKILFIRSRYGQGGRLGMEKEWRFNKKLSGGGEPLDQGIHIIDLSRYFAGDFNQVYGSAESKFWKKGIYDSAFMILKNKNITASLHVSTVQWKNLFSFEVFGDKGFLDIEGKGGSYGKETLIYGRRKPKFGVPILKKFEYPKDISWEKEWRHFLNVLKSKEKMTGTPEDGLEANRIVEAVYQSSKTNKVIKL